MGTNGQADTKKRIVAFRKLVKAPKNNVAVLKISHDHFPQAFKLVIHKDAGI
jgi:hypothetical protein